MNSNTLLLILVGIGAILAVLLLLPAGESAVEIPTPVSVGAAGGEQSRAITGRGSVPVPSVDAGVDVTVGERETVQLHGVGVDPAGGTLTYLWTAVGGLGFFSDPHVANPYYTAPSACDCQEKVTLTLIVTTRSGSSGSDQMTLWVRDPLACPATQTSCTGGSGIVTSLDPCLYASSDPCPAKPDVPCEGPCVSTAPETGFCAQVPVACRCNEDCGPTWDAAWPMPGVPVVGRDRPKPQISRQYPAHVAEGATVQLSASIRNPTCASVCFAWSASKGAFEHGDTLTPIYRAPKTDLGRGEPVTITLTIYDASGAGSYDQIRMTIDNLDYNGPLAP